jgi:hypothetical protein
LIFSVIPAKAGIQEKQAILDPGDPVPEKAGSRGDGLDDFLRGHQISEFGFRASDFGFNQTLSQSISSASKTGPSLHT